jgi:hypothetical protein
MVTFVLSLSVMALISLEEFCNVFSNLGLSDFFFFLVKFGFWGFLQGRQFGGKCQSVHVMSGTQTIKMSFHCHC